MDDWRKHEALARRFCLKSIAVKDFVRDYGRPPSSREEVIVYLKHYWPNIWEWHVLPDLGGQSPSAVGVSGQENGTGTGEAVSHRRRR
jgi:hypothetical protein